MGSQNDNPEKLATQATQDEGQSRKDHPEKLATHGTQDEEQHGTQKRTIQRNYQHRVHKMKTNTGIQNRTIQRN